MVFYVRFFACGGVVVVLSVEKIDHSCDGAGIVIFQVENAGYGFLC